MLKLGPSHVNNRGLGRPERARRKDATKGAQFQRLTTCKCNICHQFGLNYGSDSGPRGELVFKMKKFRKKPSWNKRGVCHRNEEV